MLAGARTEGVALAVVPVGALALGSLIASNRAVLIFAAIAMPLFAPLPLTSALPLHAGFQVYPSDILVLLAVASWVAAWLVNPKEARPSSLGTRLLGWPLLLFGIMLLRRDRSRSRALRREARQRPAALSALRRHRRRGYRSQVSRCLQVARRTLLCRNRLAGARRALRLCDGHVGDVGQAALSTGGERVLAGSTAMFMAGALLLALLNLELERRPGGRPFIW